MNSVKCYLRTFQSFSKANILKIHQHCINKIIVSYKNVINYFHHHKKVNIAIIVNDAYTNNFITLYNELKNDKRFNLLVIICDRLGYDFSPSLSQKEISKILQDENIAHQPYANINNIIRFRPDFIFTSNPYDIYIKPEFRSENLCKYGKLVHFSYGAALIEWEGNYQFLNDNPFLKNAHKIFTESRYIFEGNKKFQPIGYLKIDNYLHYHRQYTRFHNFSIAWKPRWTFNSDSSLVKYIDFFHRLSSSPDIILNIVIHPMLFSNLPKTNDGARIRDLFSQMQTNKNINFITGPNFLDDVLGSDIFIGDISSTLAEFLYTNKPIIFTFSNLKLNRLGDKIIGSCYTANNEHELNKLICDLINKIDPLKYKRKDLFYKVFEYDHSMSTANKLKEYLFNNA